MGLPVERGGGGAGQQVVINLILERLTLCAVGVGHGVEFLPLGGVGDILCHGLGNLRIPTAKPIALTGGSSSKSGGIGAGQQIAISLIGKDFLIIHAIGVGHGVFFLVLVRLPVSVGISLPGGSIGGVLGHPVSNYRSPAAENIAFPAGVPLNAGVPAFSGTTVF